MDVGAITLHFYCPDFASTHFADPKVMARLSKSGWLIKYRYGENAT